MTLALIFAFFATIFFVLIAGQRLAKRSKSTRPSVVGVEDFYDERTMGIVEVVSGHKHAFPIELIQQMDIGTEPELAPGKVVVYVTAECHYAEFQFSCTQYETFVATMEKALPTFEAQQAKERGLHAIASNEGSTIFISPDYPDAGIFPKYRVHSA